MLKISYCRQIIQRNYLAVAIILAATITLILSIYFFARSCAIPPRMTILATLAIATLWCCLISGIFASSGKDAFSTLLRAAAVSDGIMLALAIVWIIDHGDGNNGLHLQWSSLAKIFLILTSISLASATVVSCAKKPIARLILSLILAVGFMTLTASPAWSAGLSRSADPIIAREDIDFTIQINPFYCISAAVNTETEFIWHEHREMYHWLESQLKANQPKLPISWFHLPLYLSYLTITIQIVRRAMKRRE